jgi:hypothetical protein
MSGRFVPFDSVVIHGILPSTTVSVKATNLPVGLIKGHCRVDFAFPDLQHAPALGHEHRFDLRVSLDVGFELRCPEVWPRGWGCGESAACMAMPEAAMHEEHCSGGWKDKVGTARQSGVIDQEAKSCCVKVPPDTQFRLGRFPPDPCHHAGADLSGYGVNHDKVPSRAVPAAVRRLSPDGGSALGWAKQDLRTTCTSCQS